MPSSVFQQIQQIAALLRRFKKGQQDILPEFRGPNPTLQSRFLDLIDLDEEEVAKRLGVKPEDQSYHVLKSTVYKRALRAIFHVDLRKTKSATPHAIARDESDRVLFAAKTLSFFGLRDAAEFVARREIATCEKYEFSSNAIEFLTILTSAASTRGDTSAFKRYKSQQLQILQRYRAELEMGLLQNELMMLFTTRGVEKPQVREKLKLAAIEAHTVFRKNPTFKIGLTLFRLKGLSEEVSSEYDKAIRTYLEAEGFIESYTQFATPVRLAEFSVRRLDCAIHLRDKKQGLDAAERSLAAYAVGSFNWFITMEQSFLLYMTTLDFKNAQDTIDRATKNPQYQALDRFIQERWNLYGLYLLYAKSELRSSQKLQHRKTFKDFVRISPSYTADKVGFNMSVLIIHILYLIEAKQFTAIADRLDALEKYRARHLKANSQQANTFIKLLIAMAKADFVRQEVLNSTTELRTQLKHSDTQRPVLEGLQILPFDWLWDRIVEALPNRIQAE
jgi:hypothetical protein